MSKTDLFKQAFISQQEYRDIKNLIGFNPNNFIWKDDKKLYKNLKIK